MEDLINISNFCNTLKIKHGEHLKKCDAVYIKDEDAIEFRIQYKINKSDNYRTFQYLIENYNFIMTDLEVLVNKGIIDILNNEVESRLNILNLQ